MEARTLLDAYHGAFNARDLAGMLACVADDVKHHVNQGGARHGRGAVRAFGEHMARCSCEEVSDLVPMVADDGARGTCLRTDEGLTSACDQTYALPAGSFFAFRPGRIAHVTTYHNLPDWIAQVSR